MADQIEKGIEIIRSAAIAALSDRRVPGARVTCVSDGKPKPGAVLTISTDEIVERQTFSYEELEDSGEAIDAPAALKVRMLVSKFVR